jgi:hypothetical protein
MSQHDFDITTSDARGGAAYRAQVNLALQALVSNNAGSTAPAVTYPYQPWADVDGDMLRMRSADNSAWIDVMVLSTARPVYVPEAVSSAEIGYLRGVTSSIQDQLDGRSIFRNKIINGDMRIDQRNAGASITPSYGNTYSVDRWYGALSQASKVSLQQSDSAPAGFSHSLLITSLSSSDVPTGNSFAVRQAIEGVNVSDLSWGSTDALAITISFRVKSSLPGVFSGALQNSAQNRSYLFTYSISSANTWERKIITIPGDKAGTWLKNNGVGLLLHFSLGAASDMSAAEGAWMSGDYRSASGSVSIVGTSGATFMITGVQLESGTIATPFEFRPYELEAVQCKRYFQIYNEAPMIVSGYGYNTSDGMRVPFGFNPMRTPPTASIWNGSDGGSHTTMGVESISSTSCVFRTEPTAGNQGQYYSFKLKLEAEL